MDSHSNGIIDDKVPTVKNRDGYLDLLRGISILIVVFAHAIQSCNNMDSGNILHVIIQTFQMPLLMLISGYSAGFSEPIKNIPNAIKKKFLRLCIPYIVWVQIHYLVSALLKNTYSVKVNLMRFLDSGFWFLRILFILYLVYYLYYFLMNLIKGKLFIKTFVSILACIIAIFFIRYIPGCAPVFKYSIFFVMGNVLYKFRTCFLNKYVKQFHYIFIVVFLVSVLLYLSLDNSFIKNLIDKSMAISGCAFIAAVSYIIYKFIPVRGIKSFLKKLGENTLPIYAFHWCVLLSFHLNPMIVLVKYICLLIDNMYIMGDFMQYFYNRCGKDQYHGNAFIGF